MNWGYLDRGGWVKEAYVARRRVFRSNSRCRSFTSDENAARRSGIPLPIGIGCRPVSAVPARSPGPDGLRNHSTTRPQRLGGHLRLAGFLRRRLPRLVLDTPRTSTSHNPAKVGGPSQISGCTRRVSYGGSAQSFGAKDPKPGWSSAKPRTGSLCEIGPRQPRGRR